MAEYVFSEKSDSTANTRVKSHLSAQRSEQAGLFSSLLPVSVWPQEPYEIELFKKGWSNVAL